MLKKRKIFSFYLHNRLYYRIFVGNNELSRTFSIGKLIRLNQIPRRVLAANGGPQFLREMFKHSGLQRW